MWLYRARGAAGQQGARCYPQTTVSGIPTAPAAQPSASRDGVQQRLEVRLCNSTVDFYGKAVVGARKAPQQKEHLGNWKLAVMLDGGGRAGVGQ